MAFGLVAKEESKEKFVRARRHHGSRSLDLTIPAKIVKNSKVHDGDLFKVESAEENGNLVLRYERIYKAKKA